MTLDPNLLALDPRHFWLNLKQIPRAMALAFFVNVPFMIWGAPGIGKSTMVLHFAAQNGYVVFDLRLSDKEAQDIGGIPYPVMPQDIPGETEKQTIKRVKPYVEYLIAAGIIPFDAHELDEHGHRACAVTEPNCIGCLRCILFIDEIDRTDNPAVRNAIQQVILDRKCNGHYLSKNCRIVAAGNGESDIDTTPLGKAAAGRMVHVYAENQSEGALDSWLEWGATEYEHPELGVVTRASAMLRAYAKFNRVQFVNGAGAEQLKLAEYGSVTNRTWEYADLFIRAAEYMEANGGFRTSDILPALVAGCVGKTAAVPLLSFRDIHNNVPTIDEILADPENVKIPDRPDLLYSVTTSLVAAATRDAAIGEAIATYGVRWGHEAAAFLFDQLIKRQPTVASTTSYQKWIGRRLTSATVAHAAANPVVNRLPEMLKIFSRDFPGSAPGIESDRHVNRISIPSASNPKITYVLSQERQSLLWVCSCPAGLSSRHDCKHLQRIPADWKPSTSS